MSRGLGHLQRRVLADLEHRDRPAFCYEIAEALKLPVTPSTLSSLRRALSGLAERELAVRDRTGRKNWTLWATPTEKERSDRRLAEPWS